jgi:glutathionyl-hydroquinone reductase
MTSFSLVDDIVPVIWDTKHNTIVSNESSEIIRFLNTVSGDACCPYFF